MSRRATMLVAVSLFAAPLLLSACSSSPEEAAPTAPASSAAPSASSSTSASPSVSVDASIAAQVNPEPNQAVVPGSIESVEQQLSPECAEAVVPLRAAMDKYSNGMEIPGAERDELFNVTLAEARETCGGDASQEWSDFYYKEFAGWFYNKQE